MNILVLNVGSSTLKFQLVDTDEAKIADSRDRRLARGQVERIGGEAVITLSAADGRSTKTSAQIRDHCRGSRVRHRLAHEPRLEGADLARRRDRGGRSSRRAWRRAIHPLDTRR